MVTSPNWMAPFHIARATAGPRAVVDGPPARAERPGPHDSATLQWVLAAPDRRSAGRRPCRPDLGLGLRDAGDDRVAQPVQGLVHTDRTVRNRREGRLDSLQHVELGPDREKR